ncbi:MAG: FHA domain-containing protein [Planctomycetes bacterium]|nr:FHA domain-containing protein [Planctomycetota bacterium]
MVPHPPEGSRSRTFPVGAHLFVNLGEELHDHVLGGARLTMGRRTDNDVFVPDTLASKLHAELVAEGGRYYLEDRGSRNGTFLGKRRVEGRVSLSQAETIRIGNTYMLFCQGDVKARDQFLFCPQGHPGDRRAKFCGSCGAPLS